MLRMFKNMWESFTSSKPQPSSVTSENTPPIIPKTSSNILTSETRTIPNTDAITIASIFKVEVFLGCEQQTVIVNAEEHLMPHITTETVDGHLFISSSGNIITTNEILIKIYVSNVSEINVGGTAHVDIYKVDSKNISLITSGCSVVRVFGKTQNNNLET